MEVREPAVAYGKNKFTEEEYLKMEEQSSEKHEFYQGEIFLLHAGEMSAMSGAKVTHNIISGNIFGEIKQQLKGKPCQPFNSDQRIYFLQMHFILILIFQLYVVNPKLRMMMN